MVYPSDLRSSLKGENPRLRMADLLKPVGDRGDGELKGYAGITAASIG